MSGSMGEPDAPGGLTRWKFAEEFFKSFVDAVAPFDDDGLDIGFFNSQLQTVPAVTPNSFREEWNKRNPVAGTKLVEPLEWAFKLHFDRKAQGEGKSTLIVVLTDGEPQDRASIGPVIINATNKIDRDEELAVLFLQVGHDAQATAFLASLDDDLQGKGAKYDIVDAKNIEDVGKLSVAQLVEAAFND